MARSKNIENMSYAELTAMQARIERAKAERQSADRAALKQQMTEMAKKHGFDMRELFDGRKGREKSRLNIAIPATRRTRGRAADACRGG